MTATARALFEIADWAANLKLHDIPRAVREEAKNQVFSMLGAVHSGYASGIGGRLQLAVRPTGAGRARIFPSGQRTRAVDAAALLSAWSMALDYDDVMLGGHTGHSSVLVPFAVASEEGLDGSSVLLAQVVANEVAARINTCVALGPTRGQMAADLHLLGTAAARAKLEELPAQAFAERLLMSICYSLRGSYPAFLGSDTKALCAAWPLRQGFAAFDAAAGLNPNPGALDALFEARSPSPQPEFLGGLGGRWHTQTNSYKARPGSAYLQAAAEATESIKGRLGPGAAPIERVEVAASLFTLGMDRTSEPYLRGRDSSLATLTFCTRFAVACALRHGRFDAVAIERARGDEGVWALMNRVVLRHDPKLTVAALLGDMPVGAALKSASRWERLGFLARGGGRHGSAGSAISTLEKLAVTAAVARAPQKPISDDFAALRKPLGARVSVRLEGGRIEEEEVALPVGFAGSLDAAGRRALTRAKYLACCAASNGPVRAARAADRIDRLDQLDAAGFQELVNLNCLTETDAPRDALPQRRYDRESETEPQRRADR